MEWRGIRPFFLKLHRYVGLFLAGFLVLEGLTGSLSVFRTEIDAWLNPDLFRRTDDQKAPLLSLSELMARLSEARPHAALFTLTLRPEQGLNGRAVFSADKAGRKGEPDVLRDGEEVFFNPVTAQIIGHRLVGGQLFSRRGLIPFLYRLHYSLALGRSGTIFLGILALLWAGDCFSGLLLSLPASGRILTWSFWKKWGKIWKIRRRTSAIRLLFDLHRAPALWLWGVCLGLAVSGVALALGGQIFEPAVRAVFPSEPPPSCPIERAPATSLSLAEAQERVRHCLNRYGVTAAPNAVFFVQKADSVMFYRFSKTGADPSGLGSPLVSVNRHNGLVKILSLPGYGRSADVIMQLQSPFHSGRLAGITGRWIVCLSGLVVTLLSITGVLIFYKKYAVKLHKK